MDTRGALHKYTIVKYDNAPWTIIDHHVQLDILINPIVCFTLKLLFVMTQQPMRELAHLVNNRFEPDDSKLFPSLSCTPTKAGIHLRLS